MASITIIGTGRHGTAIAQLFASHGVDVTLNHYRPEKAEAAARVIRGVAKDATVTVEHDVRKAVAANDIVFLTTLWDQPQRKVISEVSDLLPGRTLVDVSNPLDVTPAGIIPRTPKEGSAGQFVQTLLPEGTAHAKAFSNLATAAINEGADHNPPAVLAFLADSAETAATMRELLSTTGWQPWLAGDISRSRDLEIGGLFNAVFGRYGRSRLDATEMEAHAGPEFSF